MCVKRLHGSTFRFQSPPSLGLSRRTALALNKASLLNWTSAEDHVDSAVDHVDVDFNVNSGMMTMQRASWKTLKATQGHKLHCYVLVHENLQKPPQKLDGEQQGTLETHRCSPKSSCFRFRTPIFDSLIYLIYWLGTQRVGGGPKIGENVAAAFGIQKKHLGLKMGAPNSWMVRDNPIEIDDLGVPPF